MLLPLQMPLLAFFIDPRAVLPAGLPFFGDGFSRVLQAVIQGADLLNQGRGGFLLLFGRLGAVPGGLEGFFGG